MTYEQDTLEERTTQPRIISRAEAKAAGLTRYFTGLPCPHGHIAERMVSNWYCVTCANLRTAAVRIAKKDDPEWRARQRELKRAEYRRHAEKYKARARTYEAANTDAVREMKRAYRAEKADELREYFKQRHANNREALNAAGRKRYAEKKDELVEYYRQYRVANPDKIAAHSRNAKARKKAAPGRHTAADVRALYAAQDGKCVVCGCDLAESGYHVDHIVALSRGGTNWPDNLQLLCPTHNLRKNAKPYEEFLLQYMLS